MKSIRNEVRQLNVSVKLISKENYIVRLSATRVLCNFHKTMNIWYTGVKILLKWPYTLGQISEIVEQGMNYLSQLHPLNLAVFINYNTG